MASRRFRSCPFGDEISAFCSVRGSTVVLPFVAVTFVFLCCKTLSPVSSNATSSFADYCTILFWVKHFYMFNVCWPFHVISAKSHCHTPFLENPISHQCSIILHRFEEARCNRTRVCYSSIPTLISVEWLAC